MLLKVKNTQILETASKVIELNATYFKQLLEMGNVMKMEMRCDLMEMHDSIRLMLAVQH